MNAAQAGPTCVKTPTGLRGHAKNNAEPVTGGSGQSGFGAFSHAVQFEIECGIELLLGRCPQLGDLMLEFLYATSQAYYLEGESLFGCAAYITQQSACHIATFHTTASMPDVFHGRSSTYVVYERPGGRGASPAHVRNVDAAERGAPVKRLYGRTSVTTGQPQGALRQEISALPVRTATGWHRPGTTV